MRAEQAISDRSGRRLDLRALLGVVRENREFRQYMIGMMLLGSGSMMTIPMLVVLTKEHFDISRFGQVLITSSVVLLSLFLTIPAWAKFLDSRHIIDFRAVHSWNLVAASATFAAAAILGDPWMLYLGSALLGSTYAGGQLAWNLGHNDFTDDARSAQYMAVHVTLTGVRGLLAPILGIAFYQYLDSLRPGIAVYSMLLPLVLAVTSSLYFVHLYRARRLRL